MSESTANKPATPTPQLAHEDPRDRPTDETIKETFESIIIAFVLAFVFRAYVVEAFVIPTGSMAPTLLGAHYNITCEQCGYSFAVDTPYNFQPVPPLGYAGPKDPFRRGIDVTCPMCHHKQHIEAGTPADPGDRILVHKYIYSVSEPRRWDVIVFKNPRLPHQNFIKRLVGLPNERLFIVEGNVYICPVNRDNKPVDPATGQPGSEHWRIARKVNPEANPHWEKIQRAVWQPIYHSRYVPLDAEQLEDSPMPRWRLPWVADSAHQDQWTFNGARGYRLSEPASPDAPAILNFEFARANQRGSAWYEYNQFKGIQAATIDPIEDVRLAAAFRPDQPGLTVRLSTTARIDDDPAADPVPIRLRIDTSGKLALQRQPFPAFHPSFQAAWEPLLDQQGQPLTADVGPFEPDTVRSVELWHVDQEILAFVDGRCVLRKPIDLSMRTVESRSPLPPAYRPDVTIEVAGAPVTLYDVQLDRDIYYGTQTQGNTSARAALHKERRNGQTISETTGPIWLEYDLYFALGDNSPVSQDSRYWDSVDPWIRREMLQDNQTDLGVVPRELIMGRAFFVYFPAPYRLKEKAWGFLPNFGDMRRIY